MGKQTGTRFATIPEALEELRQGRMLIVVDDEDRENEGDLVVAAELVTPAAVNFMTRHGRGLVCAPMAADRLAYLGLPAMVGENTSLHGTAFAVSVDARQGTTTGTSAFDRATTLRALAEPRSRPQDFARPGHVFPLAAADGGVLRRNGHTEACVDLVRLAGLQPVAVLCEVLAEDGSMAREGDLLALAEQHGLKILAINDLVRYRLEHDRFIRRDSTTRLPTHYGEFRAVAYTNPIDGRTQLALTKGDLRDGTPMLTRLHSECLTGEVFGSLRCDCGEQLHAAMEMVERAGRGVIVYIRQEGRGIGLSNKIRAYALQDLGNDTVEANVMLGFPPDARDYSVGAQILADLGVREIRLITNNPSKRAGLEHYGISVVERVPLEMPANQENYGYLKTKRHKLGHLLSLD